MSDTLLTVENLEVQFRSGSSTTKAVNGVSFSLNRKENIGIVGESGSGKSVTATSLLRLIPNPPGKITGGRIVFEDKDLLRLSDKEMRKIRGNEISMIFQDPSTSLNPVYTIGNQIVESIKTHQHLNKKEAKEKAIHMLELVGIPEARKRFSMYPHEFSGGMRQRVMIAIALACNPKLLIADEPTTALDVTVQAQILNLMKDLQHSIDTSIVMITHDLGVIWETCDKMLVMYAGNVVESGTVQEIYDNPLHPYTGGLLDSQITESVSSEEELNAIPGSPPDLSLDITGCPFAARCPFAEEICLKKTPEMIEAAEGHFTACHFQTKEHRLDRKEGKVHDRSNIKS